MIGSADGVRAGNERTNYAIAIERAESVVKNFELRKFVVIPRTSLKNTKVGSSDLRSVKIYWVPEELDYGSLRLIHLILQS